MTGTVTTGAVITGSIFSDNDSDKIRDSGEGGIANWRVFLDKDGDSIFDSTEAYVLSDSSGNFRFSGLAAGTYSGAPPDAAAPYAIPLTVEYKGGRAGGRSKQPAGEAYPTPARGALPLPATSSW